MSFIRKSAKCACNMWKSNGRGWTTYCTILKRIRMSDIRMNRECGVFILFGVSFDDRNSNFGDEEGTSPASFTQLSWHKQGLVARQTPVVHKSSRGKVKTARTCTQFTSSCCVSGCNTLLYCIKLKQNCCASVYTTHWTSVHFHKFWAHTLLPGHTTVLT